MLDVDYPEYDLDDEDEEWCKSQDVSLVASACYIGVHIRTIGKPYALVHEQISLIEVLHVM